jgi:DNA-binding CsgD family transcriptional regulator
MPATTQPATPISDSCRVWLAAAFLLGVIARDMLEDQNAGGALRHRQAGAGYLEALTHGEIRVLHYLPTNLSAREIADELYLSVNTVKTHQRHLYEKLGAHSRAEAVENARGLGLLAPLPISGRVRTARSATFVRRGRVRTNHPDHAISPHPCAERAGQSAEA